MEQNKYLCTLINILKGIWILSNGIQDQVDEASLAERYELWRTRYRKVYKDVVEEEEHFQIFKHNVEYIESFNAAGNKPYKLDINRFADQPIGASDDGFKRVKGNCENVYPQVRIKSYEQVPRNSERGMFRFYSSGVFTGECGTKPNLPVTIVGYGTSTDGSNYWLVKNFDTEVTDLPRMFHSFGQPMYQLLHF